MSEFLNSINSFYWWISVVVVGIVLNVFSSYFREWIDKTLSFVSTWWATRTSKKQEEWDRVVRSLVGDPDAQQRFVEKEFRQRIRQNSFLLMSGLCLFLAALPYFGMKLIDSWASASPYLKWMALLPALMSILSLFASFSDNSGAIRDQQIVRSARKIEAEISEAEKTD